MKINVFDKLIEFTHAESLGEDVLLYFVLLRLRHSRREFWRVDGLHKNRLANSHTHQTTTTLFEGRPSEFICGTKSFSCSPIDVGEEYIKGLYFAQFWVTPTKLVAYLFTIDGREAKLKKYLIHDPSDKAVCWMKSYWSIIFWDDIEAYHQEYTPELAGHRVMGKYMRFADETEKCQSKGSFFLTGKMSDRLVDLFQTFPGRHLPNLLGLVSAFSYVGVDLHSPNSSVFFLFLTALTVKKLKATAQRIREHQASALLLITNDADLDDNLMNTGHCYRLLYVMETNNFSSLYFYQLTKDR